MAAAQLIMSDNADGPGQRIRDRLSAILERDIISDSVVMSSPTKIHRSHYAEVIRCSVARMYQLSDVFIECERRIIPNYVRTEPALLKALRSLLDVDFINGDVPSSRGGKISRKHYAMKLGCDPCMLTPFVSIFIEFEQKLEIRARPLQHLPKMRIWLQDSFEDGTLIVRDNKVERLGFARQFGFRGGSYLRYPEIRALLEEYDDRVSVEKYLPEARALELDRLRKALEAEPELNMDHLTINTAALSVISNVSQGRFRDRPFLEAIAEKQRAITARAMESKIDPFFHGRVFWFSGLIEAWGSKFVERAAVRFKHIISGLSQNSSPLIYQSLFNAFVWIANSDNPHCSFVVTEARDRGKIANVGEWEEALFAYRNHLLDGIASGRVTDSSVDTVIGALRTSLEALAQGGVTPRTESRLPGVKHSRRRAGHVRSVAESPAKGREGNDYVAFARDHFEAARKLLKIDLGSGDSEAFFASIAEEVKTAADVPDDPASAVRIVLERRLNALRAKAEDIVAEADFIYRRGQDLIGKSNIDCAAFEDAYSDRTLGAYRRSVLVQKFFPLVGASDEELELGTANLLAYIDHAHGGVVPSLGHPSPVYRSFFNRQILRRGGLSTIAPMLTPDDDAVGAVLTLYLIDSGANVSVGRTLSRDCSESSDLEGHRRITGHKARARGKPIIVDLPDTASSVKAIDWLLSAGRRLMDNVQGLENLGSDADRLFLMRGKGGVQLMTANWFTSWFNKFASSIPGLASLYLTPNMIRPSVLLHTSLSNDGQLMTGMALAQHTESVSQGYQQKWPARKLYDQMIQKFLVSFEILVMKNVPDAAEKLGITADQFKMRLGNLQDTGLGTYCRDARGRAGADSVLCSTLDCWNECPHMLIVAEVEAIASLQIWQASLRRAQPEMERDQPERWEEVWLPWLCLTDVVEEKMARGMIKIWKEANERALEISSQAGYVPPKPW